MKVDPIDRLLPNIEIPDDISGCWTWVGRMRHQGYGGCSGFFGTRISHRAVWIAAVGPIPEGLELDHLCFNPACVNPDHLEPVTRQENLRRRNESYGERFPCCPKGHEYTPENTQIYRGKYRRCAQCNRDNANRAYAVKTGRL